MSKLEKMTREEKLRKGILPSDPNEYNSIVEEAYKRAKLEIENSVAKKDFQSLHSLGTSMTMLRDDGCLVSFCEPIASQITIILQEKLQNETLSDS